MPTPSLVIFFTSSSAPRLSGRAGALSVCQAELNLSHGGAATSSGQAQAAAALALSHRLGALAQAAALLALDLAPRPDPIGWRCQWRIAPRLAADLDITAQLPADLRVRPNLEAFLETLPCR